ncbi:uncharacterized protein LOC123564138 isoform X2 [Mercenaria mercenaria]|uniref:uncharacterized protein LOC123564138 isoform X2 n=1 Tax=Mercenaria mercenaria TaxID=6596 RepID=UPI00234F931C|nr:uncharacterized protein LOC123564138 isoform X2 [Mercenaria mercenaria]
MPGSNNPNTPRTRRKMPRMKGAAVQCCMCITGVFMFLGGVIMLATGITLILNYGFFDENLLPPDLQNEEGKRTVGIILTCCGALAIVISVIVSVLYFCAQSKSTAINPSELSRIPASARNATPDSLSRSRGDKRSQTGAKVNHVPNGAARTQHVKQIPGSTEVKLPRAYKKGRHRKNQRHVRRLEEIKEQDAISRKTVDGALINEGYENDTPRSGSFSSEMTLDDQNRPPKVILDDYDNRPPSECSATTSQTSDISNYRYLENDKSRRELQFLPDSVHYRDINETVSKDNGSLEHYDENSLIDNRNGDECSIGSDSLRNPVLFNSTTPSQNSDTTLPNSAGGMNVEGQHGAAQTYQPGVTDSDGSVISYKASHFTELRGEQTTGRISPQIGEVEMFTSVEAQNKGTDSR